MANQGDWREDVLKALEALFAEDDSVQRGQMMGHPNMLPVRASTHWSGAGSGQALAVARTTMQWDRRPAGHRIRRGRIHAACGGHGKHGRDKSRPYNERRHGGQHHPMGGWLVASRDDAAEWKDEEELLRQAADWTGRG